MKILRKIINQFKQPLYKDDLKNVLLYCLINAILFGVLAGALQYFANITIGIGFSILVYFIAYMIGRELRDRVFTYHILYSVLGIAFFFIGYVFYNISYLTFVTRNLSFSLELIFSNGFITYLFPFLNLKTYVGINIMNNLIDIFIIVFSGITIWRMSTYRK